MTYAHSRVLVTGGLGFIGSNLARRLVSEGAEVTVLDNLHPDYGGNRWNIADISSQLSVRVADIRDAGVIDDLIVGKHYLFNLAAQTSHVGSMQDPHTDLAINAQAQLALVESCRRLNPSVKIVYASTRQIYGKPRYIPVDEQHPIRPVDVNGVSKLAGEQFHMLYNDVYGLRACVLRLTNTYGPGMRIKDARQTFLGVWIRRLLEGRTIPIFGDGKQLRDFTHVDDCVNALLLAGLSFQVDGQAFNVGGDQALSLYDLAGMLIELGFGGEREIIPFPPERKAIDIGDFCSNSELFARTCQWVPSVDLKDGLRRTVEYYQKNLERYI